VRIDAVGIDVEYTSAGSKRDMPPIDGGNRPNGRHTGVLERLRRHVSGFQRFTFSHDDPLRIDALIQL
jgi:hypothetical protein